MKYLSRFLITGAFFAFFPHVGLALAPDDNISEFSLSMSSYETSATVTQTWTFTTVNELAVGTTLYFEFKPVLGGDPSISGWDFTNASFSSSTVSGQLSASVDLASLPILTLSGALAAGTHSVTIDNVINTTTAGQWKPSMKTQKDGTKFTEGSSFTIVASTESIAAVSVTPSSTTAGKEANYDVSFTTTSSISTGGTVELYFDTEDGAGASNAGFSLEGVTMTSSVVSGTLEVTQNNTVAEITPSAELAAGNYTITLVGVMNSSTTGNYVMRMTSLGSPATPIASSAFTIEAAELSIPANLVASKSKKRKVTLSWDAVDDATSYNMQMRHKKNGKKVKNVTTAATNVKLSKKIVKIGKAYKFRVRACNDAGCSDWSTFKKFKVKLP